MALRWIGGINAVAAALEHDASRIEELLVEGGARNPRVREIGEQARTLGIAVRAVSADALQRATSLERHQGVAAHYRAPAALDENDLDALLDRTQLPLLLVLDGVQDPHNLGACLRSAAAAGATAVIVPRDRAAGVTPVVHKASAGAVDRIALVQVTNLARALRQLKDAGVWLVGLAGEGDRSLYDIDLAGPIAIVMGGEGEGLRRLTRDTCDFVARIPMAGAVESLNVSVATGIALFEALRQRARA
jgi:23S rRNA (guanosine2251-2'-O)-methyltransferase